MRTRFTFWSGLALLLGLLTAFDTVASHVRAGEITTRRLPGDRLTYEITLTAYYDERDGRPASDAADPVPFCMGDGTTIDVRRNVRRNINPNTSINIYRFTYTYQAPGNYQISTNLIVRNRNTINLRQPSDEASFWIRTTIQVNAGLGLNSTPTLTNPPLDSARVGQRFCHNPAAFDSDGDSLAYRMAVPQEAVGQAICRGIDVVGYRDPTTIGTSRNEAQTGPASLSINAITGDLCWDSPGQAGQYNIAFIIEEWRDGVLIGEITRDMQIFVSDSRNNRPLLDPLPDLCREAGSLIEVPLRATDPDGQRLTLTAFGGIFNRDPEGNPYNPALVAQPFASLITPTQPQSGTATGLIRWQTACAHIRLEDYDVLARVVDQPGRTATQLATLQSFRIRIIGPRPQGLRAAPQATATGRAIRLNWTPYTCLPAASASSDTARMLVYRREGCGPVNIPPCTTGIPAGSGYVLIGRTAIGASTFVDTTGLRRGIQYSYRIVAQYALPAGGESVASEQVCLDLPLLAPLITQVTVDSTATTRGQITLRWTRPIGLNPQDGGAPFQYRVFRATGLTGTDFTQLTAITSSLTPGVADTVFVDRGSQAQPLNTEANAYRYRIDFYQTAPNGQLTRVDATEPAASPRLSLNPLLRAIELQWATNTPWSNDNQLHVVYRSRRGPNTPLEEVARVTVQSQPYRYTDTGQSTLVASLSLSVDSSYCYRVLTVGRYTSTTAVGGLLRNYSQIVCASPLDTTRPCAPRLSLDSLRCDAPTQQALCQQTSFANQLSWNYPPSGQQCEPAASYNVYFSRQLGGAFAKLTSVAQPSFRHESLSSVAGCYYVTALSRRGIEGPASNTVCQDVCPLFVLPNVFTPNNDGVNDVWRPSGCSLFVVSVETVIYNRWGGRVYQTREGQINWDGRSSSGQVLPSGLYYYEVVVRFGGVDPNAPPLILKGWVQLFREEGSNGG